MSFTHVLNLRSCICIIWYTYVYINLVYTSLYKLVCTCTFSRLFLCSIRRWLVRVCHVKLKCVVDRDGPKTMSFGHWQGAVPLIIYNFYINKDHPIITLLLTWLFITEPKQTTIGREASNVDWPESVLSKIWDSVDDHYETLSKVNIFTRNSVGELSLYLCRTTIYVAENGRKSNSGGCEIKGFQMV